jgi:hypothetical protein
VARSRSKRRRQNFWVAVALASTLALVTLAHDVNRLSAQTNANRTSIDKSFAALATTVVVDENHFGSSVAQLLATGSAMSRADFGAQLSSLLADGQSLDQRVAIFAHPVVANGVQDRLIDVVTQRVSASSALLSQVAQNLQLPVTTSPLMSLNAIGRKFRGADAEWARAQREFRNQPGHHRLPPSVFALSSAPLSAQIAVLTSAPTLQVLRSLSIDAVSVSPAPLPSPHGRWLILPSTSALVGVVVHNQQYVNQNFVLHLQISPANQPVQTMNVRATVGPYASYATQFSGLTFSAGEHATVKIWLTGAPVGPQAVGVRRYVVTVALAPSK